MPREGFRISGDEVVVPAARLVRSLILRISEEIYLAEDIRRLDWGLETIAHKQSESFETLRPFWPTA